VLLNFESYRFRFEQPCLGVDVWRYMTISSILVDSDSWLYVAETRFCNSSSWLDTVISTIPRSPILQAHQLTTSTYTCRITICI